MSTPWRRVTYKNAALRYLTDLTISLDPSACVTAAHAGLSIQQQTAHWLSFKGVSIMRYAC